MHKKGLTYLSPLLYVIFDYFVSSVASVSSAVSASVSSAASFSSSALYCANPYSSNTFIASSVWRYSKKAFAAAASESDASESIVSPAG